MDASGVLSSCVTVAMKSFLSRLSLTCLPMLLAATAPEARISPITSTPVQVYRAIRSSAALWRMPASLKNNWVVQSGKYRLTGCVAKGSRSVSLDSGDEPSGFIDDPIIDVPVLELAGIVAERAGDILAG